MAIVRDLLGHTPQFGKDCFLAETAAIIGDVIMGDNCSIWYSAVIRGDVHSIRIGNNVNVQDNATIHATYKKSPTKIGNHVSIAHNAVIHGCTIHDHVLVGMGAIIMDDAVVESNCIIAPGAVVTKNTVCESGSIYAGTPAKKIKDLDPKLTEEEINRISNSYHMYASWYEEKKD